MASSHRRYDAFHVIVPFLFYLEPYLLNKQDYLFARVKTQCQQFTHDSSFDSYVRSLLNCAPCLLKTCSRANVLRVLTCSRANVLRVLTCLSCLRTHVPTYLACLRAQVPTCLACLRAQVPCMLTCSRANVPCMYVCSLANVPCVITCQRASFDVTIFSLAAIVAEVAHTVEKI